MAKVVDKLLRYLLVRLAILLGLVLLGLGSSNSSEAATAKSTDRADVVHYRGEEADAPWRVAAQARIEKLRKGDLNVCVKTPDGTPVPGASVTFRMIRHEFAFGTAVTAGAICAESADYDRYRSTIEQNFNKVVFENDLKWPIWEEHPDHKQVLQAIRWLRERHIAIRGHVMVWPSWEHLPKRLLRYRLRPEDLRGAVREHIIDQVTTLHGLIDEWDVINESYHNRDLMKLLGREVMADWFKIAHREDPSVQLFYNDYVMFQGSGRGSPSRYLFDTVRFLQDCGAPIGGIGEQGHFGNKVPPPEQVLETLDSFSQLGLPIEITELDVDTSDQQFQAAYTRDFLTAAFSHPSVNGIVLWGFWERRHWKPRAALWSRDWSLRPNGEAFLRLVKQEWWTNTKALTDAAGAAGVRGFCGDYLVGIEGREAKAVHLSKEGLNVTLTAPK